MHDDLFVLLDLLANNTILAVGPSAAPPFKVLVGKSYIYEHKMREHKTDKRTSPRSLSRVLSRNAVSLPVLEVWNSRSRNTLVIKTVTQE